MEDAPKDIVVRSMQAMLRPLAKLCLRRGIKLNEMIEALKVAFVHAAKAEMAASGERPSLSRVSVMTGVHRRDIARIDKLGMVKTEGESIISKVLSQWQYNKRFQTKGRKAAQLSVKGDKSKFAELVRSVSADLNPYTVLFELERLNYVRRSGDRVQLCATSHVSRKNLREGLGFLAQDVEDLVHGVEENIFSDPPTPNLHLKTDYDNISEESLQEIRKWFLNEGRAIHQRARDFLTKFDRDTNTELPKDGQRVRVAFGTFSRVNFICKDS